MGAAVFASITAFGVVLYPQITLRIKKRPLERVFELPDVAVIIPAYNEEKTIGEKLKNVLELDYPKEKLEVFVVDNGSDKTSEVAGQFHVQVLRSERGKIKAINKGIECAKSDIIIVTDADALISRNSVRSMVSYLAGGVGLVNGFTIPKPDDLAKEDSFIKGKISYRKKEWLLRYEEGLIDSMCNAEGRLMAFRKSVVPKIPEDWLTDDYALTFFIRGKGLRLVVDKDAFVYDEFPSSSGGEIKQFRRYAFDILSTNFKNVKFLFNPGYGYFGMMTFPFRRFFPLFYPLFMIYFLFCIYLLSPLLAAASFFAGVLFLLIFSRLVFLQIISILIAYIDFLLSIFGKNNLKGGKWHTKRT
jgi:cellulose synthase/poly-beta-1,6-N-acetylglucosamine synthase-like glycosyltransferase